MEKTSRKEDNPSSVKGDLPEGLTQAEMAAETPSQDPDTIKMTEEEYNRCILGLRKKGKYSGLPENVMRERIDKILSTKYANPMNDIVFSAVFGKKENLLVMLQTLLPYAEITSIDYLSNRTVAEVPYDKFGVYDIVCRTADGSCINVEAQKIDRPINRWRWSFYLADLVKRQFSDFAKNYDKMRPSYCVIIQGKGTTWKTPDPIEVQKMVSDPSVPVGQMRLDMIKKKQWSNDDKFNDQSYWHFRMVDMYSLALFDGAFNIVVANLDKMTKTDSELKTKLDRFLFMMKNITKLATIPINIIEDFGQIVDDLALVKLSKEDLEKYVVTMYDDQDLQEIIDNENRKIVNENHELKAIIQEKDAALKENEAALEEKDATIRNNANENHELKTIIKEMIEMFPDPVLKHELRIKYNLPEKDGKE